MPGPLLYPALPSDRVCCKFAPVGFLDVPPPPRVRHLLLFLKPRAVKFEPYPQGGSSVRGLLVHGVRGYAAGLGVLPGGAAGANPWHRGPPPLTHL